MFIFWDNSNIHYSGMNNARPVIEPNSNPALYRTHFSNLFELARNGRTVTAAYAAGSIPPPSDDVWNYLTALNIKIELLEKTAAGTEQESVDMSLQTMMFRTMCDYAPDTMAVLTGDGAGAMLGKGFLADLQRIHKMGWAFEVYAWETSCNRYLKEFAELEGKFVGLEKYYFNITFIKNERRAAPLVI